MTQRQVESDSAIGDVTHLYKARATRTRTVMRAHGVAALLTIDPISIFYVSGTRNMELFTMRTPSRYLLVIEPGPMVLFEYVGCEHLAANSPVVTDVRIAEGLCRVSSGGDAAGAARRMAAEVADLIRDTDASIDSVAIDRFPYLVADELRRLGFTLSDADDVLTDARAVKMPIELPFMREAVRRVESAVDSFREAIVPGATEVEVWAELHRGLIATEGRYLCTRLMQSGPNTYPYFNECGTRRLARGDLVCLDTDALGYEGYGVDFSRTYLCGAGKPTAAQRRLTALARDQLEHNAALFGPGVEYAAIAAHAWPIPDEHQASRYYCIGHGLGLAGEFPNIPHAAPGAPYPLAGALEPGMVICIESYVGSAASHQGVKLEDQFLITETGAERMTTSPF